MAGVEGLLPRGKAPEPIAAAPRDVLGVHDLALALDVLSVEPGGDEELGESVERAFQVRGVDVEEVARVGERGCGVAGAAVLGDKTVVLAGVRILLGAEKQHVLEKVREPRARIRIVGAPHVDVERCRGLVGAGVGDDERHEPVVEHDRAIVPGVGGAALDLGAVRRRGTGQQQDERRREGAASSDSHAGGPLRRSPAPCRRDTSATRGRRHRSGPRHPRYRYAPRARALRRAARRPPP